MRINNQICLNLKTYNNAEYNSRTVINKEKKIQIIKTNGDLTKKLRLLNFDIIIILINIFLFINSEILPPMDLILTVFSHDNYIMQLPEDQSSKFYSTFPYYQNLHNYLGKQIQMAPIVRLYGTSDNGQKACVHVHGYFPFLYIKCEQYRESFLNQQFLKKFLSIVEVLFQQAYKTKRPVIFKGQIQEKYDFYGYHSRKELFLKIYLYDPLNIAHLREIFYSKAINGKIFQCYQAHISYFMHFFADLNIFGLHQIILFNFKFRKNVQFIQKFRKISSKLIPKANQNKNEISLTQLFTLHPEYFSLLQKLSSCYLELDIHYDSIVNYLYSIISNQQKSRYSLDTQNMQQIEANKDKLFKVEITKALNQFWYDQRQRRLANGMNEQVKIHIDYSKNIQSQLLVKQGNEDPLWVNFLSKQQNQKQLIKCLQSFKQSSKKGLSDELFVEKDIIQNYEDILRQRNQIMIQNVKQRWKFYGQRTKKIVNDIIKGKRNQLPEWESISEKDQESDNQLLSQQQETIIPQKTVFDQLKQAQTIRNNMAVFRNNYKVNKGQLIQQSFFSVCDYCKNSKSRCRCFLKEDSNDNVNKLFQNIRKKSQLIHSYKYKLKPPSVKQAILSNVTDNQYPYFSDINQFFRHYYIPNSFNRSKKNAQLLQRSIRIPRQFENVVTIKNQQKLPKFWRQLIPYQQKQKVYYESFLNLKYSIKPPKIKSIPKIQNQMTMEIEYTTDSTRKMQNIFACDVSQITFQVIAECSAVYSNPQKDKLIGIVYSLANEASKPKKIYGLLYIKDKIKSIQKIINQNKFNDIYCVSNEKNLILLFGLITFKFDPDLIIAFDHEKRGIYYLIHRALFHQINFCEIISRSTWDLDLIYEIVNFNQFEVVRSTYLSKQILTSSIDQKTLKSFTFNEKSLKNMIERIAAKKNRRPILRKNYVFNINVRGRVQINLYRICEFQLKLKSYTIQNICFHLFNQQIPEFTDSYLNQILNQNPSFTINYYFKRIKIIYKILDKLNLIGAVIQKSKLYGCNFASMLERGSQFKIQAIMCRVSRQSEYLLLSASKMQVAQQKLLQCRPLVLQPPKQLFVDPVLVFDFQSLYPSIMIGYNICYSTCLGSIKQLFDKETRKKRFGVSQGVSIDFNIINQICEQFSQEQAMSKLQKYIFLTPNKVAFVKKNIRQGIIPRILLQFLMSRIMMKDSSKLYQNQQIHRLLHQRQIAIKLFMNVMYGYTGASFSGRMPSAEIADSVVQTAKYCLKTCIDFIHNNPKFGGKVIYGDTDSIFYHLKGKSMKEAFEIGKQIAKILTKKFPFPIQLKFEKVYQSLVLVSKKRYYGKRFDEFNGKPKYQGKGLQCVRRDGIDLTSNLMRTILNKLFDQKDLTKIKEFFLNQYAQIKAGLKTEIEFCLSKQVKLLKYRELIPAHGMAAKQLESTDPMLLPKYGERMKYLVLKGSSKKVKDNAISLFLYKNQEIDYDYYLDKLILPPLQRTFTSILNLNDWIVNSPILFNPLSKHDFSRKYCVVCLKINTNLCYQCRYLLDERISQIENGYKKQAAICQMCVSNNQVDFNNCIEWNCKNLYQVKRKKLVMQTLLPELSLIKNAVSEFENKFE